MAISPCRWRWTTPQYVFCRYSGPSDSFEVEMKEVVVLALTALTGEYVHVVTCYGNRKVTAGGGTFSYLINLLPSSWFRPCKKDRAKRILSLELHIVYMLPYFSKTAITFELKF